ncbi:DNA polymerase III, subunit gamma and tau [[Phormidium ambiguum] IAM M-71]|uniref:DNA polymerase III subunit gamma/tau n=1 Tax=[Phormidium ambiguum] IAM M-71 TaxID=454136 RepID=A0A1U7IH30_9CYAN|nr:DNA polymerase III subunit gamma/tau [Phormidium ambiguum]OKH36412.1 DNA polymerase III, subunit gamma and tau [Phormidium ambiguum IAM M-71]
MSYEPLHHKYRPQTFAHLVGQEAIATTLTNAIQQERIAPAYLFTGPRGTGKTSSARIFAKSLNCLSSNVPTESPCGKCDVCVTIAKGSSLDVIEIDAASNTGVDNIREIIERSQFSPVQCRYKVYIIDEVHMLSTAAFNALLKTLEEPPDRVIFVLATTDPQRVLPTIISRCQRFDFRRIPLQEMVDHLWKIANQENINITKEAVTLIAQVAQGGLRDAESLLDQLSLFPGKVTVEAVWDLVGAVPERDLMEMLEAIAKEQSTNVLEIARRLMDRGREPLIVVQNLASFYRDLLIAKSAPDRPDLAIVTTPTWEKMCAFTGLGIAQILTAQKLLKDSEVQIKNTTQPRLWLEVTLLGLLPSAINQNTQPNTNHVISQNVKPGNVTQNFSKSTLQKTPVPEDSTSVKPSVKFENIQTNQEINHVVADTYKSAEVPEITETSQFPEITDREINLEQIWQQILEYLPVSGKSLFRQFGCLLSLEDSQAQIGIKTVNLLKHAQPKISDLEAALGRIFKRKIKVNLKVGTSNNTEKKPEVKIPHQKPEISDLNSTNIESKTESPEISVKIDAEKSNPPIDNFPESKAKPSISQESQKTREQSTPNLAKNPEEEELKKATQRLISLFNGEVIKFTENLEIVDTLPEKSNLRSTSEKPDFDANFEPEEETEGEQDF